MGYLEELEQALARPTPPSNAEVLRMLGRAVAELAEWRRQTRGSGQDLADRVSALETWRVQATAAAQNLNQRVTSLEARVQALENA